MASLRFFVEFHKDFAIADAMSETIFITGIGGFIGGRFADIAIQQGFSVIGIEIDRERLQKARLKIPQAEIHHASTEDLQIIEQLLKKCQWMFHAAAIVREDGDLDFFRRINVQASLNLARTARASGISGMVHLSSVMVYGFSYPDNIHEDGPLNGEGNPYCITKIEGEKVLLAFQKEQNFPLIILRPGDVYGHESGPWVLRPIEMKKAGLFHLPTNAGNMNPVYVDNICFAVLRALHSLEKKEHLGEVFNITDGTMIAWKTYFSRIFQAAGLKEAASLPAWLLHLLIFFETLLAKIRKRPPRVSPAGIHFVQRKNAVSIEKARKLLQYRPPFSFEEGMALTVQAIKEQSRK